jgi:hypothetical protein
MIIDIWISFDILRLVSLNSMSDPLMYKCHHWPRKSHDLPRNNRSSLSAHLNCLDVGLLLVQYGVYHLVGGKESVNVLESKTYHESQCEPPSSHINRTTTHTFRLREEDVLLITVSFLGLKRSYSKSGYTHNDRYPNCVKHSEDDIRPPADIPDSRGRDVHDDEVADPIGGS